jgi:hypothetical protein
MAEETKIITIDGVKYTAKKDTRINPFQDDLAMDGLYYAYYNTTNEGTKLKLSVRKGDTIISIIFNNHSLTNDGVEVKTTDISGTPWSDIRQYFDTYKQSGGRRKTRRHRSRRRKSRSGRKH